jgi:hypothetical protein
METPENSDMEEDSLVVGSDSFSTERLSTQVGTRFDRNGTLDVELERIWTEDPAVMKR